MTTDPFGADAPLGDEPELPPEPRQEDLLGLEGELSVEPDEGPPELVDEVGSPGLVAPDEEDFRSVLPGFDEEFEAALGDFAGEDGSTSWLMEFDLDDEGFDPEEALERALHEVEQAETAGLRTWVGRALLAAVSVAAGVVGAKLFLDPQATAPAVEPTEVARIEAPAPVVPPATPETQETTSPQPVEETATEPSPVVVAEPAAPEPPVVPEPSTEPAEPEVAAIEPIAPEPAAPEPALPKQEGPVIRIEPGNPGPAPVTPPVTAVPEAEPVQEGGLRQASAEELAAVWSGASIPVEAVRGAERVMTPGVGRVRVRLARGEVFEGRLYAVGQRKLWLETELGRMALLDWQVDSIEHIVTADGTPLTGGDSAGDLTGLPSVRVRTAGGVFYGKLVSRDGDSVVLVTDSGGRVTLTGAEVELAGKATTRVIDATGAQARVADEAAAETGESR